MFTFFCLREPPCWMSFPVEVDTKLREGLMSSRVFICEESTQIICIHHTPNFEPCLDLTYNILSGHISATVRICIAANDYVLLHNCDISIDSYSPVNKFYSFIIFSLLKCLVLILNLYMQFLYLRCYFLYLNIIWTLTLL